VSPDLALRELACTSSRSCWAVGWSGIAGVTAKAVVVRWNGERWQMVKAPAISDASLFDVSCVAPTDCLAVGEVGSWSESRGLSVRWTGGRWNRVPSPGTGARLVAVSCVVREQCWAVGTLDGDEGSRNLVVRWDGRAWSAS